MNKNYTKAFVLLILLSSSFNAHAWCFSLPSFRLPGSNYFSRGYSVLTGFLCAAPFAFASALNDLCHLGKMRKQAEELKQETSALQSKLQELQVQRDKHRKTMGKIVTEQNAISAGLKQVPIEINAVQCSHAEYLEQRRALLDQQIQATDATIRARIAKQMRIVNKALKKQKNEVATAIDQGREQVGQGLADIAQGLAEKEQQNVATIAAAQVQLAANKRARERLTQQAAGIVQLLQANTIKDQEALRGVTGEVDRLTERLAALGARHQAMNCQLNGNPNAPLNGINNSRLLMAIDQID